VLHEDMHAYLAACGVDGVKVDVVCGLGWAGWAGRGGMGLRCHFMVKRSPHCNPPADLLHSLLLVLLVLLLPLPQVDVQSTIGLLGSGLGGGPATAAAYHASLEASTRRHFPGNHLINCMCHSSEDLYR
jgi:hypothetical protein